jgi:hypothetical protein
MLTILKKKSGVNTMNLTPEVIRIAGQLDAISSGLSIRSETAGLIVLTSQTDNGQYIFDLKIEYDQHRGIATFDVITTESISVKEYDQIFNLLNYLNVCAGGIKFYLNPRSSEIGCSTDLYIARGAHSSELNDRLRFHMSSAMQDLTRLIECVTEKAPLREALELTIGDTAEIIRSLQ